MKLTPRDRWMCVLLPAILTALVYQFEWMRPTQNDIESLRKQVATQGPLAEREADLKLATAEHSRLERLIAAKSKPSAGHQVDFDRSLALQEISKLCETGGVTLLASTPDASARLPINLSPAANAPAGAPASPAAPQIWRLEVRGSYAGMLGLLDGFARLPALVVPLNVTMQPDADETRPLNWTLTVWL